MRPLGCCDNTNGAPTLLEVTDKLINERFAACPLRVMLFWMQARLADHFVGELRWIHEPLGLFGACHRKQRRVE